jgi:hypothetical protein
MWKNVLGLGMPEMRMWCLRIACCIPRATNTHSGCITLIAFPLQQWLPKGAPVLRLYVHCLSNIHLNFVSFLLVFHMSLSFQVYLPTYSMEQNLSWEANWFVAIQEIPRILLNPKVQYRIHNSPPPVPILSQPNPVHTPTSHLLKIHANIILPSMPVSPVVSFPPFPHQNPIHASLLPHPRYIRCPSHSSRFYHPQKIGWGV